MGGKFGPSFKGVTMELVSWPSTPLLRQALVSIEYRSRFIGKDSENNPLFDASKKLPTLTYRGTVKIHGMNCSVVVDPAKKSFYTQSRTQLLSESETCNGFYNFANNVEISKFFLDLSYALSSHFKNEYSEYAIFGEWAGQTIQKKVAVSKVPKFFTIFGVFGIDNQGEKHLIDEDLVYTMVHSQGSKPRTVYHSLDFPSFLFELNFNDVETWLLMLSSLVEDIEKVCPVGAHFGENGTGEGLVFKCLTPGWENSRYWFKLKGEKHKSSKDTTLNESKIQVQESVRDFVEYTCTENRMEQGVDLVFNQKGETPCHAKIAEFLRWVVKDILKEESDTLHASGLTSKDVTKDISAKARKWFIANY